MLHAITRAVSRSILHCELTHLERVPIDLERARAQHRAYEDCLVSLGLEVESLPEEPELPDSVFVEDTAIVLDECAVLTRPGAGSRRAEVASIGRALAPYRPLLTIQPPGALDGGDVLVAGKQIFVGLSGRSNREAFDQLKGMLSPFGYQLAAVPVQGCLHLKTALTWLGGDRMLANPRWAERSDFPGFQFVETDPSEPYAANVLRAGEALVYQSVFPKTLARLEAAGLQPALVDASELGKAEGALTCCSLIFAAPEEGADPGRLA